jgi:hypothetical protein
VNIAGRILELRESVARLLRGRTHRRIFVGTLGTYVRLPPDATKEEWRLAETIRGMDASVPEPMELLAG